MRGLAVRSLVRLCGAAFVLLAHAAAGSASAADPALPYGINAHLPSSAQLDRVAETGIAWIRVDFNRFMLEPARGVYDWTTTDAVVSDARARGLNVYATLAYTPGWANGGQPLNVPPTDAGDWYRFVYTTVSRYRGYVQHWGMWNEPNLEGFFAGTREQHIDDILRVGAQAVRAADPGSAVLGPELAMLGDWWLWLYVVLKQAAEALDIVTQHAYEDTGNQVLVEMLTPRGIMVLTRTDAKELWLTETGWDTSEVSEEAQAAYYKQVLEGVDKYGWLDKVFFYQLVDEPGSPDQWGILRVDLSPKPAYEAYQRHIASQAPGAAKHRRAVDGGMGQRSR
jgi:polysaccharide biosynthesis protein PslG